MKNIFKSLVLFFSLVFANSILLAQVKEMASIQDFDNALKNNDKLIIVKFHSNECSHCIKFKPKFLELSNDPDISDVKFLAVETNDLRSLADKYKIRSLPTVIYFKNGKPVEVAKKADKQSIKQDIARLIK